MNLATRGRIVIFVPMMFQLLLSISLLLLVYQAQEEVSRGAHSQDIVNRCNELLRVWESSMITVGLPGKADTALDSTLLHQQMSLVAEKGQEIRRILAARGGEDDLCLRLANSSAALERLVNAKTVALMTGGWATHRAEGQLEVQGLPLARAVFADLGAILHRESTNEQTTEDMKQRERDRIKLFLLIFALAGIAISIIVSAVCIIYIRARLKLMTENTRRFAARQTLMPSVSGSDELAMLDHVFHAVDRAIGEATERERALIENAAELICSVDRNAVFQRVSSYSKRLLGRQPMELIGKSVLDVVAKTDALAAHTELDAATHKEGARSFELALNSWGKGTVDTLWSTFWSDREESLFCVVSDITERKNIARLKEDFVAMISHDLRTPLMSLSLDISLLIRAGEGLLSERAEASLHVAEERVQLLIAFVNDLLDYVKWDAGKMQLVTAPLPLESLISEIRSAILSPAEPFGVEVTFDTDCHEVVEGDKERLTQLLNNLLSNAVRRSKPGDELLFSARETAEFVDISVADTGTAVAADDQSIFLPFGGRETFGHEGKLRGTGLELAICKSIVEEHHGRIGVRRDSQSRTVFWFTLPKTPTAAATVD